MHLIHADAMASEELTSYLSNSVLPGTIDLMVQRPNGFYAPYRIQSNHYDTYVLRDKDKSIRGMASIIYRQARIENSPTVVGYATDLRLSWTRDSLRFWSKNFLLALEESRKNHGAQLIYSVVSQAQSHAYNMLFRPRNIRRHYPRYFLIRRFDIVTIHGRWPWAPAAIQGIRIYKAEANDLEELAEYLETKSRPRPLSAFYTPQKLTASLERWPGLSIENFILARTSTGKIIGCVAPWDSSQIQRYIPMQYNGLSQSLDTFLKLTSWSGWTRPLSPIGQALNFSFLTHFHADNPDIVDRLIEESLRQCDSRQFVTFAHFEDDLLFRPPKHYILGRVPFALYAIIPPGDQLPETLRSHDIRGLPAIEPALL
jgi:hypothetical protein